MDHSVLKEALESMRKDLRGRVGKKLLSIEVRHHDGEEGDEKGAEYEGEEDGVDRALGRTNKEEEPSRANRLQRRIGAPLLGG